MKCMRFLEQSVVVGEHCVLRRLGDLTDAWTCVTTTNMEIKTVPTRPQPPHGSL